MQKNKQLLIGGTALQKLGSKRYTNDTDYLVNVSGKPSFFHDKEQNIDYCNASSNKFFAEIWKMEQKNNGEMASPLALLELKAYAFVQHCQNFFFAKADDCEYDIKFLVREFGLTDAPITRKYVSAGEYNEIMKIIKSVKL